MWLCLYVFAALTLCAGISISLYFYLSLFLPFFTSFPYRKRSLLVAPVADNAKERRAQRGYWSVCAGRDGQVVSVERMPLHYSRLDVASRGA
jgi:hypothetical protein